MKRNAIVARLTRVDAGLERIKHLEEQLAPTAVNSRQHHRLRAAIRIETDAYRKSLDTEQAAARRNPTLQLAAGRRPLNRTAAARKPPLVSRGRIHRRRSSPRH